MAREAPLTLQQLKTPLLSPEPTPFLLELTYTLHTFRLLDGGPAYYDRGIKPLFLKIAAHKQVAPIIANHIVVGVLYDGLTLSFGAGQQLIIQSTAFSDVSEFYRFIAIKIAELRGFAEQLGLGLCGIGFHPDRDHKNFSVVSQQLMPQWLKRLNESGRQGLEVFTSGAELSVCIKTHETKTAIEIARAAILVMPFLQALFANSPLAHGRLVDAQSYQALAWFDVDRRRSDFILPLLKHTFKIEDFLEWVLSVPMIGIMRSGRGLDVDKGSFYEYMCIPNKFVAEEDWLTHLSTICAPVKFMHGVVLSHIDSGNLEHVYAYLLMVKGLLGNQKTRLKIIGHYAPVLPSTEFARLWQKSARMGLYAQTPTQQSVRQVCMELVQWAKEGLHQLKATPAELSGLSLVEQAAGAGHSPADMIRESMVVHDAFNAHKLLQQLRV